MVDRPDIMNMTAQSALQPRRTKVQVLVKRGFVDKPLTVQLCIGHPDEQIDQSPGRIAGVWLTPDEARRLSRALAAAADDAE